jgi:histidinol phosphatase-like enzyme
MSNTEPKDPITSVERKRVVFLARSSLLVGDFVAGTEPAFAPFAFEGLKALGRSGLEPIVVASEPALALGLSSRMSLTALERDIARRLHEGADVHITGFYNCPHQPGPKGEPACLCRMPAPGLLRRAAMSHRLDLADCWLIGSTLDEVEAGRRVGCRTVLVDSGHETKWRMSPLRTPHHRAADLLGAAQSIVAAPSSINALPLGIDLTPATSGPAKSFGKSEVVERKERARTSGPLRGYVAHPTREWL